MEALQRTPPLAPPTTAPVNNVVSGNGGPRNTAATSRTQAVTPEAPDARTLVAKTLAKPLKRAKDAGQNLQAGVARAQQAVEYLQRLEAQLESIKAELAAKISSRSSSRQLENRTRELTRTLENRTTEGGDGIDADLNFNHGQPADVQFAIQGMDLEALRKQAPITLGFSIGAIGGPQMSATIEAGLSDDDIARRLDRALAPMGVRAGVDEKPQLVFRARESKWSGIKDAIAVTGRGRVDTKAFEPALAPQDWQMGNVDALRESLREVVQALARVRRSQAAASAALSAAMARNAQPDMPVSELNAVSGNFALSAASHDYASLVEISSALVGVNRDRVQALLGLR